MTDGEQDADEQSAAVLAHPYRRYLLYCLFLEGGPVRLSDVVHQIVIWGDHDATGDPWELHLEVYRSLSREHLPELVSADLISLDRDEGVVRRGPAIEAITAVLEETLTAEMDELLESEARSFGGNRPAPEELYRCLIQPARRRVLYFLLEHSSTSAEELADVLAGWRATEEGPVGPTERERIATALHHTHLPRLADAGLVDSTDGEVTLADLSLGTLDILQTARRYDEAATDSPLSESDRPHLDGDHPQR